MGIVIDLYRFVTDSWCIGTLETEDNEKLTGVEEVKVVVVAVVVEGTEFKQEGVLKAQVVK